MFIQKHQFPFHGFSSGLTGEAMPLSWQDEQLRMREHLCDSFRVTQGNYVIHIAVQDKYIPGISSDDIIDVKGNGRLIVHTTDDLSHDVAGGREGAIGQHPFPGIILQNKSRIFEDKSGYIAWSLGGDIRGHETSLAEANEEDMGEPAIVLEMVNHSVQIFRFCKHGHLQHRAVAFAFQSAAAEVKIEGSHAILTEEPFIILMVGMTAAETMGEDEQGRRGSLSTKDSVEIAHAGGNIDNFGHKINPLLFARCANSLSASVAKNRAVGSSAEGSAVNDG